MRRVLVIALLGALVAGCGGEETVSPTGPVEGTMPQAEAGDPAAGRAVFAENGCGGCHTFAPANATGKTGPNLGETLQDKDAEYIRESIVNPNAEIAEGFSQGIMPAYDQLEPKALADLVAFLQQDQA